MQRGGQHHGEVDLVSGTTWISLFQNSLNLEKKDEKGYSQSKTWQGENQERKHTERSILSTDVGKKEGWNMTIPTLSLEEQHFQSRPEFPCKQGVPKTI